MLMIGPHELAQSSSTQQFLKSPPNIPSSPLMCLLNKPPFPLRLLRLDTDTAHQLGSPSEFGSLKVSTGSEGPLEKESLPLSMRRLMRRGGHPPAPLPSSGSQSDKHHPLPSSQSTYRS